MQRYTVTILPEFARTRILAVDGRDEVLRAILPSPSQAHAKAAATLLEGLSLWVQARLSVVLAA